MTTRSSNAILTILSAASLIAAVAGVAYCVGEEPSATVAINDAAASSATAAGAGPTTRPLRDGSVRRAVANALADLPAPTDEEWGKAVTFMEEYSPNRLHAIQDGISPDSPRYNEIRKFIFRHYRELNQLKDRNDQDLYDIRVHTIQAEDEFWGLRQRLRETPESQRDSIRADLRKNVAEQLMLADKERQLRISRLEKLLSEEKEKLAADRASMSRRIEDRYRMLVRPPSQNPNRAADRKREEPASNTTASPAK